jgi:hypothetical protein
MNVHLNGFDLPNAFGDANDQGCELLKSGMHSSALLFVFC